MIDWETSGRNDAMTDIAILAENFARTPELEEALVKAWAWGSAEPLWVVPIDVHGGR